MTQEEFEQEVRLYQQAVVEAIAQAAPYCYWDYTFPPPLPTPIQILMEQDFVQFRRFCTALAAEEKPDVLIGLVKVLHACQVRDTTLSLVLLYIARRQKDLRDGALSALYGVRTLRVLPHLFVFAEKGYSQALYMIHRMLQTPEEIERGIAIARTYIDAKDYQVREPALFLLQGYSSMEKEAERILGAVQKYKDELFIDAMKDAPPEKVLDPLKALRDTIDARHIEHWDLSRAIADLEQKLQTDRQETQDV